MKPCIITKSAMGGMLSGLLRLFCLLATLVPT